MTNAIDVFFQGLLFLFLLHVIGHPIVNFVFRKSKVPQKLADLDSIQRLPLEFVTGGTLVYVLSLMLTPIHGFNAAACFSITGVAAFFYTFQHLRQTDSFKMPSIYSLIAFLSFFIALAISVGPVSHLVLASNSDGAWHTIITYSVIKDGGIPYSVVPGYLLQVPVGTHTMLAYFSVMSLVPAELVVLYSPAFFMAIIGLAGYVLGSIVSSQKLGLYASLVMICLSFYPIGITWGSVWLLLGLLVFFVDLILVISYTAVNQPLNRSGIIFVLFFGVLTGFLASSYTLIYFVFVVISLVMILFGRRNVLRKLGRMIVVLVVGFPLYAIWFYRMFIPSVGIGPPPQTTVDITQTAGYQVSSLFLPLRDIYQPQVFARTITNWFMWNYRVGYPMGFIFVFLLVSGAIFVPLLYVLRHRLNLVEGILPLYVFSVLVALIIWGVNAPSGLFYNPNIFMLRILSTELDKTVPVIGTILLPLVAAYTLTVADNGLRRKIKRHARQVSTSIILLVILISVAVAPAAEVWLLGNYRVYATASESDYQLLKWMHSNIPPDSNVLVNPYDAGQYVPSVAGQHAIEVASTGYPFITQQYEDLYDQIESGGAISITIIMLQDLNVNYVFVGSQTMIGYGAWNATYFQNNSPPFERIMSIGNSFLFAFNPT